MPPQVRAAVYLLIVVVYVYNVVHEPTLVGQLWVKTQTGTEVGAGYRLQTLYPSEFVTNGEGRWALPAGRRIPLGSVTVQLVDNAKKTLLAQQNLCFPIPILGALTGGEQKFRLTYDPSTQYLEALPTLTCMPSFAGLTLFAQAPTKAAARKLPVYVTLREIRLVATGHRNSPAEVYFRLLRNNREFSPLGVPARASKNGWLLLRDDERAALEKDMTFTVESGDVVEFQIWDRDRSALSFFRNQDDRLATVVLDTKMTGPGRHTLRDRKGSTLMVEVHR